MHQTTTILDPNFPAYQEAAFNVTGKKVISIMKARGVDKVARDQMRVFLAEQNDLLKKSAGFRKEMTRFGNPMVMGAFSSDSVGIYNPDVIPVDTYAKMKSSPQISIGLAMIKMPLYSLGWTVESEDHDVREFVKEALSPIWNGLIKSILTSIDYGFASHEKVWELKNFDIHSTTGTGRKKTHFRGKAEVYKKIKPHYPSTVRIRTDSVTDEFLGIIQEQGFGRTVTLDANKCFLFSLNDEFGNYFGQSRLKASYKPWYWKEVLTQFLMRYFERRGSPATVVTHPIGGGIDLSGNEYDNSEIALRIGQNIIENSVVTIPYESGKEGKNQWDLSYLEDEKRGEMFTEVLNYFGAQELRGLLTPERVMTQDLSTGSFSMAASHAEIFLLSEEGLIAEMESAINNVVVPPLVAFNFKSAKDIVCRINIERIQYDRKRILKEVIVEMIRNLNTIISKGGKPVQLPSIVEMSKILGIPTREFDEEYEVTEVVDEETVPNPDGDNTPKPEKTVDNKTKVKETKVPRTPVVK